ALLSGQGRPWGPGLGAGGPGLVSPRTRTWVFAGDRFPGLLYPVRRREQETSSKRVCSVDLPALPGRKGWGGADSLRACIHTPPRKQTRFPRNETVSHATKPFSTQRNGKPYLEKGAGPGPKYVGLSPLSSQGVRHRRMRLAKKTLSPAV